MSASAMIPRRRCIRNQAFTRWQQLSSGPWDALARDGGNYEGILPGDAEASMLPSSQVALGPDGFVRVEPIGTCMAVT